MSRFSEIHHPAFSTGDMDTTIRYWRDLLGAELIYGFGSPGRRQYFFRLTPMSHVAFFEWDGVESREPRHHGAPHSGAADFDHLAIGLPSLDGLWELLSELVAAGFAVSDVVDHGITYSFYTHDPNGIALEFCTLRSGNDPEKLGLLHDQKSTRIALDGPKPVSGVWPQAGPLGEDEKVIIPGEGNDHFE